VSTKPKQPKPLCVWVVEIMDLDTREWQIEASRRYRRVARDIAADCRADGCRHVRIRKYVPEV
jgi:hypothetical protein